MPSSSREIWKRKSLVELRQTEAAHTAVGGPAPGRRYTTQQINQAYVMLLSGHFQSYCRNLHSEAVDYLCAHAAPPAPPNLRIDMLRKLLTQGRKLDSGNANPGNLGSDFGRFDFDFIALVKAAHPRNEQRLKELEFLNKWRNAIAHQDFKASELGGRTTVLLKDARAWKALCNHLVREFDSVVATHLATILGTVPW